MRLVSSLLALVATAFCAWLWLIFAIARSGAFCDGGVDCRSGNEGIMEVLALLLVGTFVLVLIGLAGDWWRTLLIAAASVALLEYASLLFFGAYESDTWVGRDDPQRTFFLGLLVAVPLLVVLVVLIASGEQLVLVAGASTVGLEFLALCLAGWYRAEGGGWLLVLLTLTVATPWVAMLAALRMHEGDRGSLSSAPPTSL